MRVLNLPFSRNNSIVPSEHSDYLLKLPYSETVSNHLHTVHGSATFALAEISSGYFLNQEFPDMADRTIPVLRQARIKYQKAGQGDLFSKARIRHTNPEQIRQQLMERGRVQFTIEVRIVDQQQRAAALSEFEWLVTMKP